MKMFIMINQMLAKFKMAILDTHPSILPKIKMLCKPNIRNVPYNCTRIYVCMCMCVFGMCTNSTLSQSQISTNM